MIEDSSQSFNRIIFIDLIVLHVGVPHNCCWFVGNNYLIYWYFGTQIQKLNIMKIAVY